METSVFVERCNPLINNVSSGEGHRGGGAYDVYDCAHRATRAFLLRELTAISSAW